MQRHLVTVTETKQMSLKHFVKYVSVGYEIVMLHETFGCEDVHLIVNILYLGCYVQCIVYCKVFCVCLCQILFVVLTCWIPTTLCNDNLVYG
jgi:NADH:ubiquinone oxidoreductase subunit H